VNHRVVQKRGVVDLVVGIRELGVELDFWLVAPRQPPFCPMYSAKPRFPRPFRQKQIPSSPMKIKVLISLK